MMERQRWSELNLASICNSKDFIGKPYVLKVTSLLALLSMVDSWLDRFQHKGIVKYHVVQLVELMRS